MRPLSSALLCTAMLTVSACLPPPQVNLAHTKTVAIGAPVLELFETSDTTNTTTSSAKSITIEYMGVRNNMALFKRNAHTQLSATNTPGGSSNFVVQNSSNTSQSGITSSSISSEISGDASGTTVITKQAINFAIDLKAQDKSITVNNQKIIILAADAARLVYRVVAK